MRPLKRIVIVGPVYPYKGGISHYTGLLCKNLREKFETEMVSFSMQYPKILFRKEQKDFANNSFEVQETEYFCTQRIPLIGAQVPKNSCKGT